MRRRLTFYGPGEGYLAHLRFTGTTELDMPFVAQAPKKDMPPSNPRLRHSLYFPGARGNERKAIYNFTKGLKWQNKILGGLK